MDEDPDVQMVPFFISLSQIAVPNKLGKILLLSHDTAQLHLVSCYNAYKREALDTIHFSLLTVQTETDTECIDRRYCVKIETKLSRF